MQLKQVNIHKVKYRKYNFWFNPVFIMGNIFLKESTDISFLEELIHGQVVPD